MAMETHARNCAPFECCGLIATDFIGEVRFVYPLTNSESSTSSFNIAPEEAFGAFMHADRSGWRIGGVFHSHPGSPSTMSKRDIAESADSRWLHLIIGRDGLRCYRLEEEVAVEVAIETI